MAKKINMVKINTYEAYTKGIDFVSVPMTQGDKDIFNQLKSPFRATVTNPRNLNHHRKYFAILNLCIENGILEKVNVHESVMLHLKLRFNDLSQVLLYNQNGCFCPLSAKYCQI